MFFDLSALGEFGACGNRTPWLLFCRVHSDFKIISKKHVEQRLGSVTVFSIA